jgi:hypothetical protein
MSPPTMPYAVAQTPPPPVNAFAIVSLICGIIGCLVITPIVGIVTGIIGLRQAKKLGNGRGMAVAGILLSVLWIAGLGISGYGVYWGINKAVTEAKKPAIDTINALVDGNLDRAKASSLFTSEQLEQLSAQLKPYGHCTNLSVNSFNGQSNNGDATVHISGTATFEQAGDKGFTATLGSNKQQLLVNELNID